MTPKIKVLPNKYKRKLSISFNNGTLVFSELKKPSTSSEFISIVSREIRKGTKRLNLDFSGVESIFPNAAVPLAGLIQFYQKQGIEFRSKSNEHVDYDRILNPRTVEHSLNDKYKPLNCVWKFTTNDEINIINEAIISDLRKSCQYTEGMLDGLEWSINEVMDNVLVHSEAECGYIMAQIHSTHKNIAVTIFDTGIGIYDSFNNSQQYHPSSPADALTLCIKEGVTRDNNIGQGNGMNGLFKLTQESKGSLSIVSGKGYLRYDSNGNCKSNNDIPLVDRKHQCTCVDFFINFDSNISLDRILTFNGNHFDFTNLYIQGLEDERGNYIYNIIAVH